MIPTCQKMRIIFGVLLIPATLLIAYLFISMNSIPTCQIQTSLLIKLLRMAPPKSPDKGPGTSTTLQPPSHESYNDHSVYKIDAGTKLRVDALLRERNQTREETFYPGRVIEKPLLLNSDVCKTAPKINIVVVIYSAPGNINIRQVIRRTYANTMQYLPLQVRVAFLLGKSRDPEVQRSLVAEHVQHGDIVMGDFFDHYNNLTLKGVLGFRWVSEYCANSDVAVKIDDDAILDVDLLLDLYADNFGNRQRTFFCNVWLKNMGIQRDGKWSLPPHLFPNRASFPYFYCSGLTTILTTDLAKSLYKASKVTPFFWISDLYLFGMLPRVAGNVTYLWYGLDKYMTLRPELYQKCLDEKGELCSIFSSLLYENTLETTWLKMKKIRKSRTWAEQTYIQP